VLVGVANPPTVYAAPLLRHPPAAIRPRHPHGAGTSGPHRRGHHNDLQPRS